MTKALLKQVLGVQTKSRDTERMTAFIVQFCKDRQMTVREHDGNVYVTKGSSKLYPCIVAHTDTVHSIIGGDNFRVIETDGVLFGMDVGTLSFAGVGGDDKCGVYIALALLDELPACKAAFFRDEEIGCRGAYAADMAFFDDCAFALQADRRGADDVVIEACGDVLTSDTFNGALFKHMAKYGKEFNRDGLMTDVQELKANGLDICAINASAGYWRPHAANEYVVIHEVMNTKRFFRDICLDMGKKRWAHITPAPTYKKYEWDAADWRDWTGNSSGKHDRKEAFAGKTVAEFMRDTVKDEPDQTKDYGAGRKLKMIGGIMHLVLESLNQLEGANCPECWGHHLYFDYVEQDVWCSGCMGYVPVMIGGRQALALPAGEGAG